MAPRRPPVQTPPDPTDRAVSKVIRRNFTDVLKAKGVPSGPHYGMITNGTYVGLWGADANGLRRAMGLRPGQRIRDHMSPLQLAATFMAEAMAANRLAVSSSRGSEACRLTAIICAGRVRRMLKDEPGPDAALGQAANDAGSGEKAA